MSDSAGAPSDTILSVRGLLHRFGGLLAVNAFDLDVRRGAVHALIGPNGAGKSTLVNLLSGAMRPTEGRISFDGTNLVGLPMYRVARAGLARTFQNGRLFTRLSVIENVLIGAERRFRASFVGMLVRSPGFRAEERDLTAGAHALLDLLGMEADADRPVSTLPYGKQRKLEIARALILEPRMLLMDEPAAGLNSGEVDGLIEVIEGLRARGLTILLIEHNMGLVMRLADRITVLNFGRKIAEGTAGDVADDEQVIEAYLGRRAAHARLS